MDFSTPKAAAKHELLFSKQTLDYGLNKPIMLDEFLDTKAAAEHELLFTNLLKLCLNKRDQQSLWAKQA
jgi:hypothetical protein